MNIIRTLTFVNATNFGRSFSISATNNAAYSCKVLVVGGGSGGCSMAAKFARRLKTKDSVIVLEPCTEHYYQPLWTLIGAGITDLSESVRQARDVLPSGAKWIKDYASSIDPEACRVTTKEGHVINYEYIIVAVGLVNDYKKVPGMCEALEDPNSGVSTIYSADYCVKTWKDLQRFKGGEAIFTFPKCPIKCPGAPLKIAMLADSYFSKVNIRSKSNITYATCLPMIFGVKKYADALDKVAARKKMNVDVQMILKEINHDKKEATFHKCDDEDNLITRKFDMMHVVPFMFPPDVVRSNEKITDSLGYLDVDQFTLQHTRYPNMYGIGDCTNTPNSKTAAAITKQSYVVEQNLLATMKKDSPKEKYNGYGACPLVSSYNTCILAEFLYGGVPHETFPFNQAKERISMYYMKRYLFPFIYWHFALKGYYHGPEFVRNIVNPFGW